MTWWRRRWAGEEKELLGEEGEGALERGKTPRELRGFKGRRGVKSRAGLMRVDGHIRLVAFRLDLSMT
jgi:hypothetical protein